MASLRTANGLLLRDALVGGATVALAVVAQQESEAPEMRMFGLLATFAGLALTGLFAARDAGGGEREVAARVGGAAGVVAGLVAGLAVIAMSLVWSVNGTTEQRIQQAMIEVYSPQQQQMLAANGFTLDTLVQFSTLFQIVCCGVGLPVIGLIFGAIAGALAPQVFPPPAPPPEPPNLNRRK